MKKDRHPNGYLSFFGGDEERLYSAAVSSFYALLQKYYTTFPENNQGEALHIINSEGIAYHQHEVLYIIKPQGKYTLTRDEIQPEGLMIYTTLRAVMIYQACGLDKKRSNFW